MIEKLIILKACRDFSTLGIKSVSVDTIASSLHLSKRTIYQRFRNKQNLLTCCLQYMARQFDETLSEQIKKVPDSVSAVVQINRAVLRYTLAFCPAFYRDIRRYPELYNQMRHQYKMKIEGLYLTYFDEGRGEELYLPDFDVPQTLIFFKEQLRWLCRMPDAQQIHSMRQAFSLTLREYVRKKVVRLFNGFRQTYF